MTDLPQAPPDRDIVLDAEQLMASGDPSGAVCLLERLIEKRRGGLRAQQVLVRALMADRRPREAVACARELALLHPNLADAACALGDALLSDGQLPAAISEFQRTLRIEPAHQPARIGLAKAWLEAGEPARTLQALAGCDRTVPDVSDLATRAEAMREQQRSDAGYVRHLFDQFSGDYDRRMLGELGYSAPGILKDLASLIFPGGSALSILDLGCGTGLAGAAFKPLARMMHGIDLSPGMLEKARARAIYDELWIGDIESGPQASRHAYDLAIAADTLVYLGDLGPVMANVARRLAAAGRFLFTIETQSAEAFALGPKRRWQHSEAYLRNEAARHGFEVAGLIGCVLRHEAGEPVEGLAIALEKAFESGTAQGPGIFTREAK